MSSLATDNTSENKLLRFHDTGGYNAQQYRYGDDGTLEGDEGEQWIEFIGNLMRPPNSHGEPEHIHVPAQTAYKWHRIQSRTTRCLIEVLPNNKNAQKR